jgi:hypothetical protein
MQAAFEPVLFIVCGLGILGALLALLSANRTWKEYGKSRLLMDRDPVAGPAVGSAAALLERDTEIRQLLEARNERRERRGEPPLDVERELSRLTALQVDGSPVADARTVRLEELLNRPGTYFNPQTEILVVVDDSPELDAEIFNMEEFEGADWVQISDEVPVDEDRRDELLETFQVDHHAIISSTDEDEEADALEEELEE